MPSISLRTSAKPADLQNTLLARFKSVRAQSVHLAAPLSAEDQSAQSMPDASPTKWHLAHSTWFFETFILWPSTDYVSFDPQFGYLFNSYYESLGPRQPRPQRGLMTRPPLDAVLAYRRHVEEAMEALFSGEALSEDLQTLIVLGCHHEQQHQELILTDILHLFGQSPIHPAYDATLASKAGVHAVPTALQFLDFEGGVVEIGRSETIEPDDFTFDNETPRHEVLLRPYRLADRLVTNGEWLDFMADGGYVRPAFWLSDGWSYLQEQGWTAPLYWLEENGSWSSLTLAGRRPVELDAPVTHISYYEADAYARWCGLRLPTEAEWEHAASTIAVTGNFADAGALRPLSAQGEGGALRQVFGDCWEWTASAYTPYPGFRAVEGAVGEYNGKFMINQMILRGGSCATPKDHIRATYRNFFHPHQRWQFSGLRLAADAPAKRIVSPMVDTAFRRDVLEGLSKSKKAIPSKYFYDEAGSALFEAICELEEYYPTRTETALLQKIAPALSVSIPIGAALVEFGSGASVKTRLLLDAAPQLFAYTPLDISPDALEPAAESIRRDYPALKVTPVAGDFTRPMTLPADIAKAPHVGFFPGSTIGNFSREGAEGFLRAARTLLGKGSRFIIGVDLVKKEEVMVAAYADSKGVTRDFNLNLLTRINRELGGDFDLGAFTHKAVWNASESRMEAHLISNRAQTVAVAGRAFRFAAGEGIHTENSYKYEPDMFVSIAKAAGWSVENEWVSPSPQFAIYLLKA